MQIPPEVQQVLRRYIEEQTQNRTQFRVQSGDTVVKPDINSIADGDAVVIKASKIGRAHV